MAYTKHNWLQRLGTGLNKFKDTISGSIFALVNQPDSVTQAGTPLRADWLNEMETGIYNAHVVADAALPATSYTAADVLTKIKTVDGTGSGLDADTVDGLHAATAATGSTIVSRDASGYVYSVCFNQSFMQENIGASSYFYECNNDGWLRKKPLADVRAEIVTAGDVLTKIKTVDGAGSGLDADTVDGRQATAFVWKSSLGGSYNVNNIDRLASGVWSLYSGVNTPSDAIGILEGYSYSGDWYLQRFTDIYDGRVWTRRFYNGTTWSAWQRQPHVSYGSTVPGTLIEGDIFVKI